jgi:hypothetical protein
LTIIEFKFSEKRTHNCSSTIGLFGDVGCVVRWAT